MRKMKTNIRYILLSILAICGMLTSCTEETPLSNSSDNPSSGKVILSYSVNNQVQSRAETDEGWKDFNENKVTRLDLFIFPADNRNVIYYHETFKDNHDAQTGGYTTWDIPRTSISPDMLETGDEVYLIANYNFTSPSSIISKSDLNITLNGLDCDAKQDDFVMTGKAIVNKSNTSNDVTIQVDLIRVTAKVCLSFASPTDWNDVSYRFVHYAPTSALLEENETEHLKSQILSTSPSEEGLTEVNTQTTENLYTDEGKQKLVLYSYANDWYKPNPNTEENPDINGGTIVDGDQIYMEAPIDPDKQTYILLKAPFNGKDWYYKVPVNYQLPEDNDAITPDESYKDLYRLQRNYIYDITVTIDREGGSEKKPVETDFTIVVEPWEEKYINVPAFE